ncbi:MAG: hypothetical protein ACNA8W_12795 [Bradymonadaceae bacterium]
MKSPTSIRARRHPGSWCAVLSLGIILSLGAGACGDPAPPQGPPPDFPFNIEVYVSDQETKPLPRVPILIDGRTVGFTDRDGKFEGQLIEKPNVSVELSLGELEGYRYTTKHSVEELLRVRPNLSGEPQGLPITLRAEAQSLLTGYLFWVKAECDDHIGDQRCTNLPVRLGEDVVAHTDEHGIAHISHQSVPGRKVILTIDTPAHDPTDEDSAFYEPRQPTYEIDLDFEAAVYVIEEEFTDPIKAKAASSPVRRARPRARPRPRPAAQPSAAKQAPTKKAPPKRKTAPKQNEGGIIDLW